MDYQEVFSWAEDRNGKMVYVDDVPRGKSCNCICPNCRENLIARHGNERKHGFAHASVERGANLEICLKVIVFKLAEQIIATKKRICIPSYYEIFPPEIVEFETVEVNNCFEREDRQPDVIATTKDNRKYLIEFCFKDDVRHKQPIDYKNLDCLEVDLTGQKIDDRDSLKNFLLNSDKNRKWLNNDTYFKLIESRYKNAGKSIRIVCEEECAKCPVKRECCAVRNKSMNIGFLTILQNGKNFRLCRVEEYETRMGDYRKQQEEYDRCREANRKRYYDILNHQRKQAEEKTEPVLMHLEKNRSTQPQHPQSNRDIALMERTCFNCENNLRWKNREGLANCGCGERLRLPKSISPEQAKNCPSFKRKH